MNQYRCEKCNKIVLEIISRIQKQPELENSWNGMVNAEKNYFVGDIFNIVSSHHIDFQAEWEKVLELLNVLRRYANGEYKEAELSDNEHDMRIHLEYENRIWEIMIELRQSKEEQG